MAKKFSKKFYNSAQWKKLRSGYIQERVRIDGGLCEKCHKNFGYILHHIKELNPDNIDDAEVAINKSNLRWECKECHDREEGHFIKSKQTICAFDSNGQPIPPTQG